MNSQNSQMGGSNGKPRTCKGPFSQISYRLSQLEEARTPKGVLKVLQRIIPDIVAKDIDAADEVPSCSKGTLVDVKTISPGDVCPDNRTGKSNAAINARQARVNQDYHMKAKDLDTRLGRGQRGEFDAELSTFCQDGVVLGPIAGAYGEISSHADLLADVTADALTAEHLTYYGDKGSKTDGLLPPGALSRVGAHRPSWVGTPYARPPEPRTNPERPTGPKPAPPCS